MAVYPHPHEPRVLVAYSFFGSRVLTSRWFDNNDHFRPYGWSDEVWVYLRSLGVIRLRYWGRA